MESCNECFYASILEMAKHLFSLKSYCQSTDGEMHAFIGVIFIQTVEYKCKARLVWGELYYSWAIFSIIACMQSHVQLFIISTKFIAFYNEKIIKKPHCPTP